LADSPFVLVGGSVTHELEAVAPFDQGQPSGDQVLQLDGFDLAAISFTSGAFSRSLVAVEFALDPVGGAVEDVDGRPEEIVEVGFEAAVSQGEGQGVKDVRDRAGDDSGFGQGARIGFVVEGAPAVESKFSENMESAKASSAGAAAWAKREAAYLEWRMVISSKSSTPHSIRFWQTARR
ncbi:hypothetical protein OY671_009390, partial [Metschnikowia pulcherrima]